MRLAFSFHRVTGLHSHCSGVNEKICVFTSTTIRKCFTLVETVRILSELAAISIVMYRSDVTPNNKDADLTDRSPSTAIQPVREITILVCRRSFPSAINSTNTHFVPFIDRMNLVDLDSISPTTSPTIITTGMATTIGRSATSNHIFQISIKFVAFPEKDFYWHFHERINSMEREGRIE